MSAGTPRSLTIDGIPFDVAADANLSGLLSIYEKSKIATSGKAMTKMVKRVPTVESVVLVTDWAAKVTLTAIAEQLADISFSIEYADGTVAKSDGAFNIESDESEENRTTIAIHPSEGWTIFVA